MLTPLDIENKKFQRKMMNGYNVDEVDDFLDEITVDYEKLYKENTELRAEIERSKSDIDKYKTIEANNRKPSVRAASYYLFGIAPGPAHFPIIPICFPAGFVINW